jgi:DNA-3-methyladenine glycosylase II
MTTRIDTEADIAAGMAHLVAVCPTLRAVAAETGPPPLRRSPGGFPGLVRIVVAQQLSVASAAAIQKKVEAAIPALDPKRFAKADDAALRAAGLSAPKIRTLRAAAEAAVARRIDFDRLAGAPIETVHERLTALPGIGPWTADIYAMFCLGHGDAFAAGDLALQEAARIAFELDGRPKPDVFLALARHWRPWRAVAARLLWAYYRVAKDREGVVEAAR